MIELPNATIEEMQMWAHMVMCSRPADQVIGENYLRRWYVVPRNPFGNVYLHEMVGSDDDRALHDHPWNNRSVVLFGGYFEHQPDRRVDWREPGAVIDREAGVLHRLELPVGGRAVSLFMTGAKVREWGFACPQGWVHWRDFTDPENPNLSGRGCGEFV